MVTRETMVVAGLVLNLLVLVASLVWAWRGDLLTGLDDRNTNLHPEPTRKEPTHG